MGMPTRSWTRSWRSFHCSSIARAGAATRIREVRSAEAQAASSVGVTDRVANADLALEGLPDGDEVDDDDADVDDDDLVFDEDAFGAEGAP
jgi:hypothetical protein